MSASAHLPALSSSEETSVCFGELPLLMVIVRSAICVWAIGNRVC